MKNLLLFPIALIAITIFISCNAISQTLQYDRIVKKDSSIIEAKILTVATETVNYKKASYLNGPEFQLSKNSIAYIQYANGEIEHFETIVPEVSAYPILYSKEPWTHPSFTYDLTPYRDSDLDNAKKFYTQKIKGFKILATVFTTVGTASIITGLVNYAKEKNRYYDYSYSYSYIGFTDPKIAGPIIGGILSTVLVDVIAIVKVKQYKKKEAAVSDEINKRKLAFQNFNLQPTYNPFTKSANVTMRFNF